MEQGAEVSGEGGGVAGDDADQRGFEAEELFDDLGAEAGARRVSEDEVGLLAEFGEIFVDVHVRNAEVDGGALGVEGAIVGRAA